MLSAFIIAMSFLFASALPASADETGGNSDVGAFSAFQCIAAPGPGTWNDNCIDVQGTGGYVSTVRSFLTGTVAPYFPADVCNVKIDVWGLTSLGEPWSDTYTNNSCGSGSLGAIFSPQRSFANNSYMCSRTTHSAGASAANCIIIRL